MKIRRTPDGKAYLHIWRGGNIYDSQKRLLNYREWTNIKFTLLPYLPDPYVSIHDIRRPLRFPDNSFDAAYACHVMEHLSPGEGKNFVSELYRVLKPGGVCRISVPDLESICREYLKSLEECISEPSQKNIQKHNWSVMELIDQMVRDKSGGLMLEALKKGDFDVEYIQNRYGDVFADFYHASPEQTLLEKILSRTPKELLYEFLRRAKLLPLRGDPRKTREANKWMHDRLSLKLLLEGQGFEDFSVKSFDKSEIENWERYNFDKSDNGEYALEPSLYVEGKKMPAKI